MSQHVLLEEGRSTVAGHQQQDETTMEQQQQLSNSSNSNKKPGDQYWKSIPHTTTGYHV
jgi:hypothetical protein